MDDRELQLSDPDEDTSWQGVDAEAFDPTPEEIEKGNELGQKIDLDDDEDNGL